MQTLGQRILLVEDQAEIAAFLTPYLKEVGLVVHLAPNLRAARDYLEKEHHGLIILDVMLPDGDGMQFCKELRDAGDPTPVIMLTARDEDRDKIAGLDAGADDYVTKPFNAEEMVARVRALLRRANLKPARSYKLKISYENFDLILDGSARTVVLNDIEVTFAPKEFDLLWELMDNAPRVLNREELLKKVWGYTYIFDTRTVDVHVRGIRRKLGDDNVPISTVWGKGYKVQSEVEKIEN